MPHRLSGQDLRGFYVSAGERGEARSFEGSTNSEEADIPFNRLKSERTTYATPVAHRVPLEVALYIGNTPQYLVRAP